MRSPFPRPPYRPFADGSYRLAMGLMPVDEADWFEFGEYLAAALAAKRILLAERHGAVFEAHPEAEAPAAELLALMAAHLPRHHPALFRREGDRLFNLATDEAWNLAAPDLHPLDLAGRLVAEDLCLLEARAESYVLAGASLCSPARWRLAEKMGQPLTAIHAPVPGYAESLGAPVDRFVAALKPGRLVGRLNWGASDDPEPFQPVARGRAPGITNVNAGERLWLRVERQTLRRLERSGAVVFTIRTHITRLDRVIASPAEAQMLAAAIRAMPRAMQEYKQIAPVAEPLLGWLSRFA
ncbi:MAG: heme-dependent oxidative N-demethylase family protein [Stellaceae bacterium]